MKSNETNMTQTALNTAKYGTYTLVLLSIIFYNFRIDGQWQDVLPYFVLLMVSGIGRDWIDLSNLGRLGTFVFDIFLIALIGWVAGGGTYFILFFVIISEAIMTVPVLYSFPVVILATLVQGFLQLYVSVFIYKYVNLTGAVVNFTIFIAALLFIVSMSIFTRSKQKAMQKVQELYERLAASNRELELAHLQLKEYTVKVEELTISQERNRMAREIHDTLGHTLMGIIVSLEVSRKVLDSDLDRAREEISKAQEAARSGLQDVRRSISSLRPRHLEDQSFSEAIIKVIDEVKESTGLDVTLEVKGTPCQMYPSMEVALYRSMQEAMTNAVRHGQASQVHICLEYTQDEVTLDIHDNGKGCSHFKKGFGLIGMEERAQALGGRIMVESGYGTGFQIHCRIPLRR